MSRKSETAPVWRGLLWLAMVFAAAGSPVCPAANSGGTNFEAPPPRIGSAQWLDSQQAAKERQEKYRVRVAVPADAAAANAPRVDSQNSFAPLPAAAVVPAPSAAPGKVFKFFAFAAVAAVAGILLLHKFSPPAFARLNRRFNPWAGDAPPGPAFTDNVRAEDAPFARFVAGYQAGLPAAPPAGLSAAEIRAREFSAGAAAMLDGLRAVLANAIGEAEMPARKKWLAELCAGMGRLKALADFPEALPVWQTAAAVEGLLNQLAEKMDEVTPSTLRTVAGGLGLLEDLCAAAVQPHLLTGRPLKFLVVDDDLLGRHALSFALGKAFSRPDLAADGAAALVCAGRQAYDVIFLDVQMPGMDGFELCVKIREGGLNRATPVVFVTAHADFEARKKSTLSGGNELLGKPFLTFEITVKALTLGLQGRLQAHAQKAARRRSLEAMLLPAETARPGAGAGISTWPPPPPTNDTGPLTGMFLARARRQAGALREFCEKIRLAPDSAARQSVLAEGFLCVNALIAPADGEIAHPAFKLAVALEGLFRKLLEDARHATPSTLATLAAAVETLDELCGPELPAGLASQPPVGLLVVDDDLLARRAIVGALQTLFGRPESVEDGGAALALAAERVFDVIFLDVVMPGMDGFEVCAKIRQGGLNRDTPVIFVTDRNSPEAQAEMARSGGDGLLAKPFLVSEITVKALTCALRSRLRRLAGRPQWQI